MDEGNVDICDETGNADTVIEKSNGDKESDSKAFLQDRNGANKFELENDFNRPISAIAVDASTSSEDTVMIARGTATGSVELEEQIGDRRIVTNVQSQKVHSLTHSVDLEAKYIDCQKTLDLEKRLKTKNQDFEDNIDLETVELLSEAPKVPSDSSQDSVNFEDNVDFEKLLSKVDLVKLFDFMKTLLSETRKVLSDLQDRFVNFEDKAPSKVPSDPQDLVNVEDGIDLEKLLSEAPKVPSVSPDLVNCEDNIDLEKLLSEVNLVKCEDNIDFMKTLFSKAPSKVPSDPQLDLVNSAVDGQPLSTTSSNSLSRNYVYTSVTVEDIPVKKKNYGDKQILVPKYKADGSGYCWPIDKLPLSGAGSFHEGQQWTTAPATNPLGCGASGECFVGYTVKKQDKKLLDDIENRFCVKKLHKYNREEVVSLYLAGKDQHDQKQTAASLNGSINIVPFYGATYWKENVCIFMELMEGGTVEELLKDFELQKDNYLRYLKDVLSGLAFLHVKGIVHNDIKAGNVLLDRNKFHAKLADFGNASPIYNNDNSKRKDILSAGCFLLEMLGNFMKPNKILTLKLSCTSGCAENLPQHNDSDTNAIVHMFFGATSEKNTAFDIAKQLNVFCKAG